MKKKIASLVVFIAVAVMSISGTMAYFTADEIATNVITSGDIDIILYEMEEVDDVLKPFEDKDGVMPGENISKIVYVKNDGSNPAYIRIKVDKQVTLADGTNSAAGLQLVTCDFNTKDWTYKDGYYYYNEALAPDAETTPLFTTVTFSKAMGNEFQNCKATINVWAQAVQVKNNGATVFDAAAESWPIVQQ